MTFYKVSAIDEKLLKSQFSTGCCPNPFSLCLKRFLINLRLAPGNAARSDSVQAVRRNLCAILALRAQTVGIADLPLRQDL